MVDIAKDAALERVAGERPGRSKAVVAAIVVGFGTALLVYRLLRSDADEAPEDEQDWTPSDEPAQQTTRLLDRRQTAHAGVAQSTRVPLARPPSRKVAGTSTGLRPVGRHKLKRSLDFTGAHGAATGRDTLTFPNSPHAHQAEPAARSPGGETQDSQVAGAD
jgi:hypothetical protein